MTRGSADCVVVVTNASADDAPVTPLRGKRRMRDTEVKGEGRNMLARGRTHEPHDRGTKSNPDRTAPYGHAPGEAAVEVSAQ